MFLETLRDLLWGPPLLIFLVGSGIYLTFLLKGIQFRYLGYAIKETFKAGKKDSQGDISPFQALMTSLAGAIGTGTIVGVATAITVGGLGALFWMWITALFGMATKYSESLLAVKFRELDEAGEMSGGPMQYIEKGLSWRPLALIFALAGILSALTTGNLVQANAISQAIEHITKIDPFWIGGGLAFFTGAILLGGISSIGRVASVLVPLMALLYFLGAAGILILHFAKIPAALTLIFQSAFQGQAALGGFMGSTISLAIQMGVTRSIFSNEAGLGISSIAAAAAKTDSPGKQAMINMTGALVSTMILCTMTGLVLAVTGVVGKVDARGNPLTGASLALHAFDTSFFGGGYVVMLGLILFAFSTIIAWGYYGEKCSEYLFGTRSILPFRLLFTLAIFPGAIMHLDLVWQLADICNALLVIPNLIALIALSSVIKEETALFKREQQALSQTS